MYNMDIIQEVDGMGRLTKRHGKYAVQIGAETRRHDEAWLKLAHYEDLEEQGSKMVNIDEVVKQLEEESWSVGCSFAPKENRTAIIKTEKAIEIVKGGAE